MISKQGLPIFTDENFITPQVYYDKANLDDRTNAANIVLNHLLNTTSKNAKKILVIGHSEGGDVAAKLATINKHITHLGFWCSGGTTQLQELIQGVRKQQKEGYFPADTAQIIVDSLINQYKLMYKKPQSTKDFWNGHTYKRWTSFSVPPVENLLQVNIPLFVATATEDRSSPIESSDLIPVEFIRKGKNNLTYKVYINKNHSFDDYDKKPTHTGWSMVLKDFLKWVDEH